MTTKLEHPNPRKEFRGRTPDTSLMVLKGLLNQKEEKDADRLMKFTPKKIHAELSSIVFRPSGLSNLTFPALFSKIDKSWIREELLSLSKNDCKVYLSCFEEEKREALAQELGIHPPFYTFRESLKAYLLGLLFKRIFGDQNLPLPLSFLPKEKTTPFIEGSTEKYEQLFFFLGLYDLAFELKHIINASILRQLEETLSDKEIQFLQKVRLSKNPLFIKNLNIANWNGDANLLREVLTDRGIYRFGKTLSHTTRHTLWYILHILPKTIARRIELENPPIQETSLLNELIEQTLETWYNLE